MATKATIKKETASKTAKKKPAAKKKAAPAVIADVPATLVVAVSERYVYAVGRRKTAVAQVRLYAASKAEGAIVNQRPIREYFGTPALETVALAPLKMTGLENDFRVTVLVRGGGLHGQAGAIRLGVAR